jgi:hypothetical protein
MTRPVRLVLALIVAASLASPASAAITYTQAAALAVDTVFIGQVLVSVEKAAVSINAEATTVAGHRERAALATRVMADPDVWKLKFANACAGNLTSTLSGVSATDAQVDTAVSSVWNTMAGYFAQ